MTKLMGLLLEACDRLVPQTGRSILTCLLGMPLAALWIQFVADGVKSKTTG